MKCNLWYKCEVCKTETTETKKSHKEAFYKMSFITQCEHCGSNNLHIKIEPLKKWEKKI